MTKYHILLWSHVGRLS